jgi:hypothetical protein
LTSCIGWLFDVFIDNDHAFLWIKTEDGQIFKLRDLYHPGFYILPRNESDGSYLFQILSREEVVYSNKSKEKHKSSLDNSNGDDEELDEDAHHEETREISSQTASKREHQKLH